MDSSATVEGGTPSVTPEPSYPNARPGEKPPARPVDILSDAGAEAFAVYFVKTLDWAYATMDTELLEGASSANCKLCSTFINEFAMRSAAGERFRGSRSEIKFAAVVSQVAPGGTLSNVVFDASPLDVLDASGRVLDSSPATVGFQMNVRAEFIEGRWVVVEARKVIAQ